jgi:hypothetical protein
MKKRNIAKDASELNMITENRSEMLANLNKRDSTVKELMCIKDVHSSKCKDSIQLQHSYKETFNIQIITNGRISLYEVQEMNKSTTKSEKRTVLKEKTLSDKKVNRRQSCT